MSNRRLAFLRTLTLGLALIASNFLAPRQAKAEFLTMIPPKIETTGTPGQTISQSLRVRNDGGTVTTYDAAVQDFVAVGDQGSVDFVDEKAAHTNYALASWISISPKTFTLEPNTEQVIGFNIRIPETAEPGGHFASVYVQSVADPVKGNGATVQSRLGSLILLRVSGNVSEKLSLTNFRTPSKTFKSGPIEFIFRSKNEGNVHSAPSGTITITNTIGRKVAEIPLKVANVFPGAEREVSTIWESKNLIGRYTATVVAGYGQNNEPLTSSTTFYVFPIWLLAVAGGIIALIFLARINKKRIRKILHRLTAE